MEEETKNRLTGTACTMLFEDTNTKFVTGSKIDYKPTKKCDDSDNTDTFYPAYIIHAQPEGTICKYTVK